MHLMCNLQTKIIIMFQVMLSWIYMIACTENVKIHESHSECQEIFHRNLEKCLNLSVFYKLRQNMRDDNKLIVKIFMEYQCRQYEASLQCIHEQLSSCRTGETTHTVQRYLSQSWALHANYLCNINQPNNSIKHFQNFQLQKSINKQKDSALHWRSKGHFRKLEINVDSKFKHHSISQTVSDQKPAEQSSTTKEITVNTGNKIAIIQTYGQGSNQDHHSSSNTVQMNMDGGSFYKSRDIAHTSNNRLHLSEILQIILSKVVTEENTDRL